MEYGYNKADNLMGRQEVKLWKDLNHLEIFVTYSQHDKWAYHKPQAALFP
jgi:hypothetical protein